MLEDDSLVKDCQNGADTLEQAIAWVNDNREHVRNESDGLVADLHRSARLLEKLKSAAQRKMCVSVFGPSQSGKSYLISALARGADGDLLADFGQARPDFVSDINPEGGKESTGLVTRFTMSRPHSIPDGFPVKIRLLSEADLVRILGNAFYEDFNHEQIPDSQPVVEILNSLAGRMIAGPGTLTQYEAEDLHEYFRDNFKHCPRMQMLETYFWKRAVEMAPRLSPADRVTLFGLVWNGAQQFNALYARLISALGKLDFTGEAFCPLTALIPRDLSIIDVATLAGLASTASGSSLEIVGVNGRRATLARNEIAALTAEISIVMVNKPDDFFDHTDLLDFPGYRSRKKNTDIERVMASEGAVEELFLRGKVAYLFERYCAERELTSMLLCIGPGPAEVQSLPRVVDIWVRSTHGDTPAHRDKRANALFFVMTKFDMEFSKKKGAAQSEESRWDTRVQASLTSFFGGVGDWVESWGTGRAFNNVFWVRNPNVRAEALFQYDSGGRELSVRPEQETYLTELKAGYLRSTLVARHVAEPETGWDAAMALSDGGVTYLRDRLRPLCNPALKRSQIGERLSDELSRIANRLALYFRSDDKEQERKLKSELAKKLAGRLAQSAQSQRFGQLLRGLQVADHELYDLFFRIENSPQPSDSEEGTELVQNAPQANIVGAGVSADDLLGDIFGSAPTSTAPEVAQVRVFRDAAAVRAAEVEKFWLDSIRALSDDSSAQAFFGIPAPDFSALVHELALGVCRLGVDARIEKEIRIASRFQNIKRDKLVWKQVSRAAVVINSYINWLGFDPRDIAPEQRRVVISGRDIAVFQTRASIGDLPDVGEDQLAYDVQYYRDWIASFVGLVAANVDFEGGVNFDPTQNLRLGQVLRDLGFSAPNTAA